MPMHFVLGSILLTRQLHDHGVMVLFLITEIIVWTIWEFLQILWNFTLDRDGML